MLTLKHSLCLTKKEAEQISELLYTLASMIGTSDDTFNEECHKAGKIRNQMNLLIGRIQEKKKNNY